MSCFLSVQKNPEYIFYQLFGSAATYLRIFAAYCHYCDRFELSVLYLVKKEFVKSDLEREEADEQK